MTFEFDFPDEQVEVNVDDTFSIDFSGGIYPQGLPGEDGHSPVLTSERTGSKQTTIYSDGEPLATILDGIDGTDGEDGQDGEDGTDGVSPTVTVEDITGGHRVTITDAQGSQTYDVMDGVDGQDGKDGKDGKDGQNGSDGYSPSASVSKSGKTATISITDKNGTTTATVSDGQDGQDGQDGSDGYTPVKGTDYWTSADKAEMEQDILQSQTVTDMQDAITSLNGDLTKKYEKPSGGIPASDLAPNVIPEVPVQDVQINGTSILNQGVADFPIAGQDTLGLVKVYNGSFTGIGQNQGLLFISSASDSMLKAGTNTNKPIVPSNQHISAFYALAKAAGDFTQSASSNAVGTYTEAAQGAIRKMLGTPGNSDIAYVETGVVAQRAYKAGGYFVDSDGILSKTTDAIASGGSLVLGTNYEHVGGQGGLANDLTYSAELVGSVTLTGDDVPTADATISIPLSKPCKHLVVVIKNGTENIPAWSYLRLNYAASRPCLQVRAATNHKYAFCIIDLINKYGITFLKPTSDNYAASQIGGTFTVSEQILNNSVAKEVGFSASSGYAEGFSINIYGR